MGTGFFLRDDAPRDFGRHIGDIAFGKPFIGNPDLVERLRTDAPLFDAPLSAYFGGSAEGYTHFTLPEAVAA